MKKIQISLLTEESKELISRGVLLHPKFIKAYENNKVLLKGGTTVSRISEKLVGKPLRICGRVTERGTVSSYKILNEFHSIILQNKSYKNIDNNFVDEVGKLGPNDLIVCSANIIDNNGNAALMAGSEGGGKVGLSLGAWYSEGIDVLIPVGMEKMVKGNVNDIIKKTGRKNKDFSYGMSVGLFPIIGEIITEIEAIKLIGNFDVFPIGCGGLGKASGSITLEVHGEESEVDNFVEIIKNIKSPKCRISGNEESLKECSFPSENCSNHIGCSYKSGELNDKKKALLGLVTIGQLEII